jgi:hypothetical protein
MLTKMNISALPIFLILLAWAIWNRTKEIEIFPSQCRGLNIFVIFAAIGAWVFSCYWTLDSVTRVIGLPFTAAVYELHDGKWFDSWVTSQCRPDCEFPVLAPFVPIAAHIVYSTQNRETNHKGCREVMAQRRLRLRSLVGQARSDGGRRLGSIMQAIQPAIASPVESELDPPCRHIQHSPENVGTHSTQGKT